jgi:protein-serine/threonine kinase
MPVSRNAIDLMMRLLDERQDRLSAKRYRENDWVLRDKAAGARRNRNINTTGHIVYPNDAEDIKSHPFFRNIQWSQLHQTRPPFVPRVHGGQPITKYFDDEAEIMSASDHLDSSSYEAVGELLVSNLAGRVGENETTPLVQPAARQKSIAKPAQALFAKSLQEMKRRKREKKRSGRRVLLWATHTVGLGFRCKTWRTRSLLRDLTSLGLGWWLRVLSIVDTSCPVHNA